MTSLYSRRPSFVIGFHGCDLEVRDMIVMTQLAMKKSENEYDWLGQRTIFKSVSGILIASRDFLSREGFLHKIILNK